MEEDILLRWILNFDCMFYSKLICILLHVRVFLKWIYHCPQIYKEGSHFSEMVNISNPF